MLALLKPGIDIVTASPYHPAGGVDGDGRPTGLLFSKGASFLYRAARPAPAHLYGDVSGLSRRGDQAHLHQIDGFLMVTELLVGALLEGYKVAEFPATLRVRRYGQSKARVWQITRSHLRFQAHVAAGVSPRWGDRLARSAS